MSVRIGNALSSGFDKLLSPVGGIFLVAMLAYQLAFLALTYTVMADLLSGFGSPETLGIPFVLPVSTGVAALLGLALWVLGVSLNVVVARSFVSGQVDSLAPETYSRRMVGATLHFFVGTVVVGLLVFVGTLLLVIPGLFLAASLVFVTFYIAVEDDGVVAAMQHSWGLARGNRLRILGLVLLISISFGIVNGLVGVVVPAASVVGLAVTSVLGSLVALYIVACLADAYNQLQADQETTAA